ncbi:MAG: hypothetical protein F4121_10590 [Acidimicrobiia bacterium]|nr:hypothetical protein [Acidimicrobiia bacterium]MYC45370.1 hypothetical protein [Acidimicrobiia bacterium]MYI20491.1 hypothetical protein [Acidimicrobiia bacterium]
MLMVLAARSATLDAGSVALAICRYWSDAGRRSLFIDADLNGTSLADRFNEAMRADCSPALRGMPSLVVSGEPLRLDTVARHSYTVAGASDNMWLLFAPLNKTGARHTAGWLGERSGDVLRLSAERQVVVSSSLQRRDPHLHPLLGDAPAVVVLAAAETNKQVAELRALCRDSGLADVDARRRLLVVDGPSTFGDEQLLSETGLEVVGRIPAIADEKVLRVLVERKPAGSPRRRAFARRLTVLANDLDSLLSSEPPVATPITGRDQRSPRDGFGPFAHALASASAARERWEHGAA